MTPRSRYDEKVKTSVCFVAVVGVTSVKLLNTALGVKCNNFAYELRKLGLLKATRICGLPFGLLSLSRSGRELAEIHLGREVSCRRMDTFSTNTLSHDLMTQEALLSGLEAVGRSAGVRVDLLHFLKHARESRDLVHLDKWSRPDILFVNPETNTGYALELERSQKGSTELVQQKMHRLYRFAGNAGLAHLSIDFAIRGGSKVLDRYRRCWEAVQEEADRDGIRDAGQVRCYFRSVEDYPGMR